MDYLIPTPEIELLEEENIKPAPVINLKNISQK